MKRLFFRFLSLQPLDIYFLYFFYNLSNAITLFYKLDFAKNTVLSYFFFIALIIDLIILNPCNYAQIFNPIAKLVIPIGIAIKEPKTEIEINPEILEAKIRKC